MSSEVLNNLAPRSRLLSLTIENFRGVRDRMFFDLDASVVLLWGPNGTGKTTLFDAMLWLLQGDLPRLAIHTMRKNEDYVGNTYRRGVPATVTARFQGVQHQYEITREGNAYESILEIKEDGKYVSGDADSILEDILASGSLPLREVVSTSGLLQQDDLRLLLREKPDQRYRQLLRLLGLEMLEQFERQLLARQKDARSNTRAALKALETQRARVVELTEEVETIQALVAHASSEGVGFFPRAAVAEEFDSISTSSSELSSSTRLASFKAEAEELGRRLQRATGELEQLPNEAHLEPSAISEEVLAEAETELEAAREARTAAEQERAAVQATQDSINQLAQVAIPLLQASDANLDHLVTCPVCQTPIEAVRTIESLTERAQLGALAAAAQRRFEIAISAETLASDSLNRVKTTIQVRRSQEAELQRQESNAIALRNLLLSLGEGDELRVLGLQFPAPAKPSTSVLEQLTEVRPKVSLRLQQASREVARLVTVATSAIARMQAAEASMNTSAQLPQVQARLGTAQAVLKDRQSAYDQLRRSESLATSLVSAATAGTEKIFRERFEGLEPLMNDIYGRLDPHPTFTKLDFRVETYNNRGTATATVTDEDEGVEGNPLLIFSSAQANIVVLSAFLALGWAAKDTGLPFVLMDDPLQSLDDVNVLGFADLIRQLRRQRQVILSTHEERFARVLERKLVGRRPGESLLVHRFVGWSRTGPNIDSRRFEAETEPSLRVVAS